MVATAISDDSQAAPSEAQDAGRDAWLRVSRADTSEVEPLRAWLTTIVARVARNVLRSRMVRREQPLAVRLAGLSV